MGPIWDYNGALGNADYFEAWEPEGWHFNNSEFPTDNSWAFRWYTRLLQDENFRTPRAARWAELRQGKLSIERLHGDIDATASLLSEAAGRNFEVWEVLGEYVWPNDFGAEDRQTYQSEVDYLKSWIAARVEWMDEAVPED
jgi:hypothetical protein